MKVAMIGLHKRFCDESFFEKVYGLIRGHDFNASDLVLLITCNRIEIYIANPNIAERHSEIIEKIRQPFEENIEKRFYTFMGFDVLKHLAQVASGLDSLIYGESDIQYQVKKSYELCGKELNSDGHFLFQKALHIAKKVRHEFDIKPLKSLEDQVYTQVQDAINSQTRRICFVGNSDLNRKICKKMSLIPQLEITLVTDAMVFVDDIFEGTQKISYDLLPNSRPFDCVICATNFKHLIEVPVKQDGMIIDLSRPKVLKKPEQNIFYLDLSYFEKNSETQALRQVMLKLDALDYIHNNAKRLQNLRLMSFQMRAC